MEVEEPPQPYNHPKSSSREDALLTVLHSHASLYPLHTKPLTDCAQPPAPWLTIPPSHSASLPNCMSVPATVSHPPPVSLTHPHPLSRSLLVHLPSHCLSAPATVSLTHATPPHPIPAGNLELESVDLSGCRFLTAFSCASPSLQQLTAASCSRLHSLTLVTHSLRTLLLPNCKALANIHASAAAPAGATASTTAGATAVDDEATAAAGRGGRQQMVQDGGGSSRGGSSGRRLRVVLDTKGCVSLTAEGRARLAAAMAV